MLAGWGEAAVQDDAGNVVREGLLVRKNVLERRDRKATSRSWRPMYAVLRRDEGIALFKSDGTTRRPPVRPHGHMGHRGGAVQGRWRGVGMFG